MNVSAVIPLFNEEPSLHELFTRLEANLSKMGNWEIIFIDDGSSDRSLEVLRTLHDREARVRIISFRKNYGKSAALHAGFKAARGQYVITLDADLQDDPAEFQSLIRKLEEGYDLVSGWKEKRKDPIEKKLPSKLFNSVVGLLTGIRLHDFNCGLKAYRREVIAEVPVYGEMHRFIPALVHWAGFRVTELPVQHHPRKHGRSKYGAKRYLSGFLDLLSVIFLVRFAKKPMHLFGLGGMLFTFAGLLILGYLTWGWMQGVWIGDRPLFFLGILLMVFGVQSFSLGLIGELLTRFTADRGEYSAKLFVGFDQEPF
ncbi:glycosyltransferase family 2 protein [bacterium]|nr:glycosyltransferase family 2 protein [bacterium]MBU1652711.1 glycosyltransferase family 2 protein [bacterium]